MGPGSLNEMKAYNRVLLAAGVASTIAVLSVYAVSVKRRPEVSKPGVRRVVSLSTSAAETLIAIGAGSKLVGVDDYTKKCLPECRNLPSVGTGAKVSLESVLGLSPDLVIAWSYDGDSVRRLRGLGLHVAALDVPHGVQEVLDLIVRTAAEVGLEREGKRLVKGIETDLAAAARRERTPGPLVYYELYTGYKSVGKGTYTHELIERAGGRNLAGDSPVRYPILNSERIIEMDPDVIIVCEGGDSPEAIRARPGWSGLKAVRQNRIHVMPTKLSTPGPDLPKALRQMIKWFQTQGAEAPSE